MRLQGLLIVGSSRQRAEQQQQQQLRVRRLDAPQQSLFYFLKGRRKLPEAARCTSEPRVAPKELMMNFKKRRESRSGLYPPAASRAPRSLRWQHQRLNTTPVGGRAGGGEEVRPGVPPLTSRNASSRAEAPAKRTRRGQSSHLSSASPTNPDNPCSTAKPILPFPSYPPLPPTSSSLPFHLRHFFFTFGMKV